MAITRSVIKAIIFLLIQSMSKTLKIETKENKKSSIFKRIGYMSNESRKLIF